MVILGLALLAMLIVANAFYVMAEFAAVSVRQSRLAARAGDGDRLAQAALDQIEDPERLDDFVAACQVGITLSSLALGAVGQAQLAPVIAPWLERVGVGGAVAAHSTAAVVILVALTTLQMVLGELVPKSLALHAPTRAVRWVALPMRWSSRILSGFVVVLNGSGRLILRALGHSAIGHTHVHSPEELEYLVAESGSGGVLQREESRRLQRALAMRRRTARHLMTPRTRVQALDASLSPAELTRIALEGPFTRYPVYRDDPESIVGILHTRDLAARVLSADPLPPVEELLRPVVAVPEGMLSERLLKIMRRERALQVVVLDEYGGLAGIVSSSDLLRDVLGAVPEDFGGARATVETLPDGRLRLPGRLPIDRASKLTAATWPDDSYTVAGAVLTAIGHLPEAGERTAIAGLDVEVERVEHQTIASVLVSLTSREKPTEPLGRPPREAVDG